MMAGTVPPRQTRPRRGRQLIPPGQPRRRELIGGGALALFLVHLLLAQLTLLLAVAFTVAGRSTRWRLWWLLGPAAAGLAWTLAIGPHQALAGFTAGPAALLGRLGPGRPAAPGGHPAALAEIGAWLPRQFPLALPLAAVEAAVAGWLAWLRTDEWALPPPRPGAVAALRAAVAARAIRAGGVLTRAGCALGVVPATGAVAELGWAEVAGGVLVAAAGERPVTLAGLQLVHAALRRRKAVIVLDDGRDRGIAAALAATCRATGTPLRSAAAAGRAPGAGPPAATAGASELWGRGDAGGGERAAGTAPRPGAHGGLTDLLLVVSERSAVLLPASSPELAAAACAALAALADDLRRIGVDGDALVWVPRADAVPGDALAALLGDGAATGLAVLAGTTACATAAELVGAAGAVLIGPLTDPELAAVLASRTGTRLLPAEAAAGLAGQLPEAGLVPSPAVPASVLLGLAPGEFVLAVRAPRPRLIAPGRLVAARLPRPLPPDAPGAPAPPAGRPGRRS